MPTFDEALAFLMDYARSPRRVQFSSTYGYSIYLHRVIEAYRSETSGTPAGPIGPTDEASSIFMDAAWELCRIGVLRPGITRFGGQVTDEGSGGAGFSITEYGRQFVSDPDRPDIALLPGRASQLVEQLAMRFGGGFLQRAKEALRCYRSASYLATCVMCGAAAESILLAVAIGKTKDEPTVLRRYRAANGRRDVTNLVVGSLSGGLRSNFESHTGLLTPWRDAAAHGLTTTISEVEAHLAIMQLIRFAQFASDQWGALTAP